MFHRHDVLCRIRRCARSLTFKVKLILPGEYFKRKNLVSWGSKNLNYLVK